jgi:hypothetical protein
MILMEQENHQSTLEDGERMAAAVATSSAAQQQITPDLFAARTADRATPPPAELNKTAVQAQIISPSLTAQNTCYMALPKGQLVILMQGAGVAALKEAPLTLKYYSKGEDYGQSTEVASQATPIRSLLQEQEEGVYRLEMALDFSSHLPDLKQGDFIKINFLERPEAQISYRPRPDLQLETPEQLETGKAKLEERMLNLWFKAEEVEAVQTYLPDLELTAHRSGQFYVPTPAALAQVQQQPLPTWVDNLEALSKEELGSQQTELADRRALLEKIAYKLDYNAFPYEQLEQNYEGEQRAALLDQAFWNGRRMIIPQIWRLKQIKSCG